jgi:hypothetical protein
MNVEEYKKKVRFDRVRYVNMFHFFIYFAVEFEKYRNPFSYDIAFF